MFNDYSAAFLNADQPFIDFYPAAANAATQSLTRAEFLLLAERAAGLLIDEGLERYDTFAFCPTDNRVHDLALRLAGSMTGMIAVAINGRTDPIERFIAKIKASKAKIAFIDNGIARDLLVALRDACPTLRICYLTEIDEAEAFDDPALFDDRIKDTDPRLIFCNTALNADPIGFRWNWGQCRTQWQAIDSALGLMPDEPCAVFVAQPLGDAGATMLADWAMRRPNARLSLLEHDGDRVWPLLSSLITETADRVFTQIDAAGLVEIHKRMADGNYPIDRAPFAETLARVEFIVAADPAQQLVTGALRVIVLPGFSETTP
ncbi:MAG: hypothetical protein ABIH86_02550 [Planctomycetota bacterium]